MTREEYLQSVTVFWMVHIPRERYKVCCISESNAGDRPADTLSVTGFYPSVMTVAIHNILHVDYEVEKYLFCEVGVSDFGRDFVRTVVKCDSPETFEEIYDRRNH